MNYENSDELYPEQGEPPAKMSRGDSYELELRFLIPSKAAGAVIGKGGENIRYLRENFSARVNVPDSNGPERVFILNGTLRSLMAILLETIPKLDGCTSASGDVDLRMLVHQSQVGGVIGKGGHKIKEMRESSNLKQLKLYSETCPNSTDRVIQFIGQLDDILHIFPKLVDAIESSPIKGVRQDYDARCFDDGGSPGYGGWSIGYNEGIRPGAYGGGGAGGYGRDHGPRRSGGSGGGFNRGRMDNPPSNRSGRSNYNNNNNAVGVAPRQNMQSGFLMGSDSAERTTTQVSIPDNLIGSIMGKGGQRINQIREESCAEIKISHPEQDMDDRIITISGTPDQIQNAQYLLQMCVKKYSGRY